MMLCVDVIVLAQSHANGLRWIGTALVAVFYAVIVWAYLRRGPAKATSPSITAHVAAITATLTPFVFPLLGGSPLTTGRMLVRQRPSFSHSSARAVCDVPRNAPDDVLETLAANEGVCMVTFVPYFVSQAYVDWVAGAREAAPELNPLRPEDQAKLADSYDVPKPAVTLDDVVAHIEHVRGIAGVDHIGIGGDYDGCPQFPDGLADVASYPALFEALADRGWNDTELAKLAGGNILRVLRAADEAAA
jgi:hypothetical protein